MSKLLLVLLTLPLLATTIAHADRPVCGFDDLRGACFMNFEVADDWIWLGELVDEDRDGDTDFYIAWFPGANDSWLRYNPSGAIFFHGASNRAPFIYCPDSRYVVFGDPSDPTDDFLSPSALDPLSLPDSAINHPQWGQRFETCVFGAGKVKANIFRDTDFSMGPGLVVTLTGEARDPVGSNLFQVTSAWRWPKGKSLWTQWFLTADLEP